MVILGCIAREAAGRVGLRLSALRLEVIVTALAVLATAASVRSAGMLVSVVAGLAVAGVSAVTDVQTGYVFDRVLIAGGLPILIAGIVTGDLPALAAGALIGGGVPALLYTVTSGRGIGLGDVKLGAVLGGAAGPKEALHLIAVAFIVGGLIAAVLLFGRRYSPGRAIPFAPFLAIGAGLSFGSMWPR